MSNEVKEILEAALALIEKGWTRGVVARDAAGRCVEAHDPSACSWCASGALMAAAGVRPGSSDWPASYSSARRALGDQLGGLSIHSANDAATKDDVVAAYHRAIEAQP